MSEQPLRIFDDSPSLDQNVNLSNNLLNIFKNNVTESEDNSENKNHYRLNSSIFRSVNENRANNHPIQINNNFYINQFFNFNPDNNQNLNQNNSLQQSEATDELFDDKVLNYNSNFEKDP